MTPRVLNRRTASTSELADAIYVGRPTKWGNPFQIGRDAGGTHWSREEVIQLFRTWVPMNHPELIEQARRELRGKDLVCWCAPKDCHAWFWIEVANT